MKVDEYRKLLIHDFTAVLVLTFLSITPIR